jgi:hypothetical protein
LDFSEIPTETLTRWYRLALLLTGRRATAEAVLLATFSEVSSLFDQIRGEKSQHEAFVRRLRNRCVELTSPEHGNGEADVPSFAHNVAAMPEPTRSAMALFYLKLLTPSEIAVFLNTSLEEVADLLAHGRAVLQDIEAFSEFASRSGS